MNIDELQLQILRSGVVNVIRILYWSQLRERFTSKKNKDLVRDSSNWTNTIVVIAFEHLYVINFCTLRGIHKKCIFVVNMLYRLSS